MSTFNILSWNVRGLNSQVKHTQTHLKDGDVHRLQNKYYKMLACSCALNKSKGVLILYKRSLSLYVDSMWKDDCGQFVYAATRINHTKVLLTSTYAPNVCDHQFMDNIPGTLINFNDYHIILGADFNACVHTELDRSSTDSVSFRVFKVLETQRKNGV
uniref:Endonuclease/exonuclease/phosphatase domain-containing protein n=1 Tax=Cyprinus carpio TaxID=7962 RepID=A0A8C1RZA8_CYPCA